MKLVCLFLSIGVVLSGEFTHDPTVIFADGLYWMFYTADGIGVKYSTDAKTWNEGVRIFSQPKTWWKDYVPNKTDFNIWAPDISYYGGYYNLFYSVSTFGSNKSVIGLIRCTSILKGDWEDKGMVISSKEGSAYNAIDPGFVLKDNDNPYMVFGSFFGGIYIVPLDNKTLKTKDKPKLIATRGGTNAIEGACIWNRGNGYYYLFASFDNCCQGTKSTYSIRYARSKNIEGPYLDASDKSMLSGGGTKLTGTSGTMIGPGGQHIFAKPDGKMGIAYHYYDGSNNGQATLQIRGIKTVNGWPVFDV